ncbi:MAG: hypothetical protein CBB87_05185 [Micavibrio sp. TMED27]|nr:heparinase [Micavibrio sp.]OUT91419.1 MAG: hypothetical protein CBB87_05185 [Micavibrio sp. TMED27]|tara:strand:+ start:23319 stop:24953 length:1635 start_codon:yes stop_codon:yes gene_type:complete
MPSLLNHIKKSAGQMAYDSYLYSWSLRGYVPERLVVRPVDQWAGESERGATLCAGELPEAYKGRGAALHDFVFLRDLRAYAYTSGQAKMVRAQARAMINSWIFSHGQRWEQDAWNLGVCGQRCALWISHYEFFSKLDDDFDAGMDDEDFQDIFLESLAMQGAHLSSAFMRDDEDLVGLDALFAIQGLLYVGLAFEGYEKYVDQALMYLKEQLNTQFFGDGGHKTRSPVVLLRALSVLLDIRGALQAGGYPQPVILGEVIERAAQAVSFFRYTDKSFAGFNGGYEYDPQLIDAVISQAACKGRSVKSLAQSGYEKIQVGRTSIMFDVGRTPSAPYDDCCHAAPLAFEMCYGRERVFVNCGTHISSHEWADALRATPAHSSLTLSDRNACEFYGEGQFDRRATKVQSVRNEQPGSGVLEATHNGYEGLNGFVHRRRIAIADNGYDVRGEDILTSHMMPAEALDVAIRFHLHPRVMVSLIRGGEEALIRMPGGAGWRFHFSGGSMALQDSVYLGDGLNVRKTKQLVISGKFLDKKCRISWVMRKEGA